VGDCFDELERVEQGTDGQHDNGQHDNAQSLERRAVPTSSFSRADTDKLMEEARARVKARNDGRNNDRHNDGRNNARHNDDRRNHDNNRDDPMRCSPCDEFSLTSVNMMVVDDDGDEGVLGAVTQVRVRPAADSGACDHVINPDELPDDAFVSPNTTGKHFKGANDSVIENYGDVETILESDLGAISCGWKAANVSRPLHSLSKIAGPPGGIANSKQDILINNDVCVVVPPGIVAEILKRVTPVASYAREGNLYVGDMVLSSFPRQGPKA
jgi:hypothetical protein